MPNSTRTQVLRVSYMYDGCIKPFIAFADSIEDAGCVQQMILRCAPSAHHNQRFTVECIQDRAMVQPQIAQYA